MRSDPATGAALCVEELRVELGGRLILDDLRLAVEPGEVLAVLGPSGGGKTTLLRAIAGLVPLTGGRVVLDGRDVTTTAAHRRGVGVMFQQHALFPHRDVAGNVAFGLEVAHAPRVERSARVRELLELVGLSGYEGRAVSSLSGGEAQRVALARSLAARPRVLCLDEPLGALDRSLHQRLLTDLRTTLRRSRVTTLHVTHDRAEALAVADRVAILAAGRIRQVGPPEQVWRTPVDEWVARFLGFEGVVDAVVADGTLVIGGVRVGAAPRRSEGRCRVLVRPEACTLADVDAGDVLRSVILDVQFTGAGWEVAVGLPDEPDGVVRVPVSDPGGARPGDRIGLRVDPAGVAVLPGSTGA